ncbi:HMG domain-containing protein 3 [Exaiptasia diaphana]|nr:HMG domain-containing protein 3 [Exaiptasia diaphana]
MCDRGQGSCPNCGEKYFNRYKPPNCTACNNFLGGTYTARKKAKKNNPECVLVIENLGAKIYSVKTHPRDFRCLVVEEREIFQCHATKCLQVRSTYVNSEKAEEFKCCHVAKTKGASSPLKSLHLTGELIDNYKCDQTTKDALSNFMASSSLPSLVQVSEMNYCVNGQTSATNPTGYCHVKRDSNTIQCSSQECKTFVSRTKHVRQRKICLHVHVLLCCDGQITDEQVDDEQVTEDHAASEESPSASNSRDSTIRLNTMREIPYVIPESILKTIIENDSKTALKMAGWPEMFCPPEELCPLCSSCLSDPRSHPGLFNIADKVLLSLDILLEWRELLKRGVPSVAIESKVEVLCKKSKHDVSSLAYLTNLFYNGFYCFEAMTTRNMDDTICGICGVIGEIYLGDGNEKNCCSTSEVDYTRPQTRAESSQEASPLSLEEFLLKIKRLWVERTSFTRLEKSSKVSAFEVPPLIAPQLRANKIVNTELKKNSNFLKDDINNIQGDPALLHVLIKKGLNISEVESMDIESLKKLNSQCGISGDLSRKSKQLLKGNIQKLHASLLVGNCPCYAFTQVKGCTGGFYHLVCRHGVTVASKFLLLRESVRDAADLYLSLKYPPTVFVCDTACGFVRHMDCRNREISNQLWGDYSGCFEIPSLDCEPTKGVDVPGIVPSEFRTGGTTVNTNEE